MHDRDDHEQNCSPAMNPAAHFRPYEERLRPPVVWEFQSETGPAEDDEGDEHQAVAKTLEGVHPDCAGALRWRAISTEAAGQQLAEPVTEVVQNHEPDGAGDDEKVEHAYKRDGIGFVIALGLVDASEREAGAGSGVAVSASGRQILSVRHCLGIRGWQDVVHAVTARAISDALLAFLQSQAMERGIEGRQTVGGKAEPARQADIAMALSAGISNVIRIDRGRGVAGFKDLMLAVTIGTNGRVENASRKRLAMDAAFKLVGNVGVAHSKGIGHGFAEFRRAGARCFMRRAVACAAFGSSLISVADGLSVDSGSIIAADGRMTAGAGGFGNTLRMRIIIMLYVALRAGDGSVRRRRYLFSLVFMAG